MRFQTSHRLRYPYVRTSPKGGRKRDFASKIQLQSKEVFCKVSLCENFQRQLQLAYVIRSSSRPI